MYITDIKKEKIYITEVDFFLNKYFSLSVC